MNVLNLGSMNLDYVYSVDHIVQPGETEASANMQVFLGGKGFNQSAALAKAGTIVFQGGMIGEDGQPFLDACLEYGIHGEYIGWAEGKSGHAIIQLDASAQNSILLFGGANQKLEPAYVDALLEKFDTGDMLLLQNEVNLLPYIVEKAYEKGLRIALNPSPFHEDLHRIDLSKISVFLLNEIEGAQLTDAVQSDEILKRLRSLFPKALIVLTLGKDGALCAEGENTSYQKIFPVQPVDTTAAGDTFTGYFLAGWLEGLSTSAAMELAAMAAAIAVTRQGAAPSIPSRAEVEAALHQFKSEHSEHEMKGNTT